MASFAELNDQNIVLRVVKISNDAILDDFGKEKEGIGVAFCKKTFGGGRWVQCSAMAAFRRHFPSAGWSYDPDRDAFIGKKPYDNWVLNEQTLLYEPPVPYPSDGKIYIWNQSSGAWDYVSDVSLTEAV